MDRPTHDVDRAEMREVIDGNGFFLHLEVATFADDIELFTYAYTTGLHSQGDPEIILTGADDDKAAHFHWLLAAFEVQGGWSGDDVSFGGHRFKAVEVPLDFVADRHDRMSAWVAYYTDLELVVNPPRLVQLVWSDHRGVYPDEPGCNPDVVELQPLLHLPHYREIRPLGW